jgi:hypothetical protein
MDISKISDTLSDFFSSNKLELTCMLAASAAYHIYQHQKKGESNKTNKPTNQPVPMVSRLSNKCIESERVDSTVAIPSSILNSENSLIDEVQHLYNPTCKITKVPHLILELVPIPPARALNRFPPSSPPFSATTKKQTSWEGLASFPKNHLSIGAPMSSPKTASMPVKNSSTPPPGFWQDPENICTLNLVRSRLLLSHAEVSVPASMWSSDKYTLLLLCTAALKFGELDMDTWVSTQEKITGLECMKNLLESSCTREELSLGVREEGSMQERSSMQSSRRGSIKYMSSEETELIEA